MKDAYYFSHDSNARNDIKCLELRSIHGYEGYGIFWAICEVLRDQPKWNWRYDKISMLALATQVEADKLKNVIDTCVDVGLFIIKDGLISSESLTRRMEKFEEIRKTNSENGKKGGRPKTQKKPTALNSPKPNESETKASKEKESKLKETMDNVYTHEIPTLEQCKQVAEMSGHHPDYGQRYFEMRDADGWTKPRGTSGNLYPIVNWRNDYANCYNRGYLDKKQNNPENEYKVVDGGVFT